MSEIVVLIPSRARPDAAREAEQSALDCSSAVSVYVGVEPEDAGAYADAGVPGVTILADGGSYVAAMRELHRVAATRMATQTYVLAADDFRFPAHWDVFVRAAIAEQLPRDRSGAPVGLLYGDDGIQHAALATCPIVTRALVDLMGDILPGDYTHLWCDTEVTDIARRAGVLRYLPHLHIDHRHHSIGAAPYDPTYARANATHSAGSAIYGARAPERERIAARIRAAIVPA